MRTRSIVATAAMTLVLAACSSSSSGGYGGGGGSSTGAATGATTVSTSAVGDLGTVLVDGNGRTLYLFKNDTGTTSTCTGSCAPTWPALSTDGTATAGTGVEAGKLGTTARDDGTTQVTYDGHPLYLYSGDTAPGDANGEGIGNVWYAVTADGAAAMAAGASASSSSGYTRG